MKNFHVTFSKDNKVKGGAFFATRSEAEAWQNTIIAKNRWGKPGEYSSEIRPYEIPADEKRQKEYQKEIDPKFQEAVLDYIAGEPAKMLALIDTYGKIKQRHPKT